MVVDFEVGSSRSSEGVSDEVLIQAFLDGFIQGQTVLKSNQNLRIEPLFDSMQLLSAKEGVIATAKVKSMPITMKVRYGVLYWDLLFDRLTTQMFYPLERVSQDSTYLFRFTEVPEGYTIFCTTAKELWRACWGRGFAVRSGIPLDLLIWRQGPAGSKENWFSLRGMDCDQGTLKAKMLGWTSTLDSSELVVWARREAPSPYASGTANKSGTRGYIPFRQ